MFLREVEKNIYTDNPFTLRMVRLGREFYILAANFKFLDILHANNKFPDQGPVVQS